MPTEADHWLSHVSRQVLGPTTVEHSNVDDLQEAARRVESQAKIGKTANARGLTGELSARYRSKEHCCLACPRLLCGESESGRDLSKARATRY
jgi:hypothetical protein